MKRTSESNRKWAGRLGAAALGALGHGVAVMLGRDPKRQLSDDLMRMKNFIETGIVPHDAAKPITATRSP